MSSSMPSLQVEENGESLHQEALYQQLIQVHRDLAVAQLTVGRPYTLPTDREAIQWSFENNIYPANLSTAARKARKRQVRREQFEKMRAELARVSVKTESEAGVGAERSPDAAPVTPAEYGGSSVYNARQVRLVPSQRAIQVLISPSGVPKGAPLRRRLSATRLQFAEEEMAERRQGMLLPAVQPQRHYFRDSWLDRRARGFAGSWEMEAQIED